MKFMQLFSLYISRDKKKRNKLGLSWTKLRSSCDRALLRIKFLNCIYSHEKIPLLPLSILLCFGYQLYMTGEVLGNGRDWQRILREGVKTPRMNKLMLYFLKEQDLDLNCKP